MKLPQLEPICAIATPAGVGAVAIIRVSGKETITKCDALFKAKNPAKNLRSTPSHSMVLGDFIFQNEIIDEVLISVFRNPNSYTGEEVVEINTHGSIYIQKKILEILHQNGIRPAREGEFTLRAYLNKKLDLSQAEAVADLIASESSADHLLALQQMRGGFTTELKELRLKLIDFISLIELELDFAEEDVEFADRSEFTLLLQTIHEKLQTLLDSFSYGNVIKEGVPVAIAGKPNAGKSSLLNAIFKEEKAIVSDIAGTTRDAIEDTLIIEGIKFRFIDTAGLRQTEDSIEKIGVEKAKSKVQQARILLYVFDENDTQAEEIIQDISSLYHSGLEVILVQNKIDVLGGFFPSTLKEKLKESLFDQYTQNMIGLSAKNPDDIQRLSNALVEIIQNMPHSDVVVSNSRHFHSLQQSLLHIEKVQAGLAHHMSGDLLAQDVRQALYYLGEITGEIDVDKDILGNIFGKFCIGK